VNSRSNRAFSLIEVLLAAGIVSVCLVFIFQGLRAALTGARAGQNIYLAGELAKNKLWELKQQQLQSVLPITGVRETKTLQGREFFLFYTIRPLPNELVEADLTVQWKDAPNSPLKEFVTTAYLQRKTT
jgi:prepilin-type N-terminal cleavage/methylation domain-containing protein